MVVSLPDDWSCFWPICIATRRLQLFLTYLHRYQVTGAVCDLSASLPDDWSHLWPICIASLQDDWSRLWPVWIATKRPAVCDLSASLPDDRSSLWSICIGTRRLEPFVTYLHRIATRLETFVTCLHRYQTTGAICDLSASLPDSGSG